MLSRTMSKSTAAKRPAKNGPAPAKTGLGALPEWNLDDLYSGLDDPLIKRDLDRADADCVAFEEAYKCAAMKRSTILSGG
jgi:oligoendopeptidase F